TISDVVEQTGTGYEISEYALPDKTVIWELIITINNNYAAYGYVTIALGDQLPGGAAEFNALTRVFPGCENELGEKGVITVVGMSMIQIRNIRKLIKPQGNRFVLRYYNPAAGNRIVTVGLVISSIPYEIPD
ncbi:MAG: hypothetical protein AMJ79_12805, partial [Phycisphaerae bacterium SM23_30]